MPGRAAPSSTLPCGLAQTRAQSVATLLRLCAAAVPAAALAVTHRQRVRAKMETHASLTLRRLKPPATLSMASMSEPIWQLVGDPLDASTATTSSSAESIQGVEGALLVRNVLSSAECARLIALFEEVGFTAGSELVEVPTEIRSNEVVVALVPQEVVARLSVRLSPHVDQAGHDADGGQPSRRCEPFINTRWRCYRYLPPSDGEGQRFGPHHDGAQPLSAVRDGRVIDDEPPKGVVRLSQKTVLLYVRLGGLNPHAANHARCARTLTLRVVAASVRVRSTPV